LSLLAISLARRQLHIFFQLAFSTHASLSMLKWLFNFCDQR
jgi:hypothetical protein